MADFDSAERDSFGNLLVRFKKEDGGWHRVCIPAGNDVDAALNAVDAHLKGTLGDVTGVKSADRTQVKERERGRSK